MRVAVDGLIFEAQAYGGVSRIFRTIMPLMCELEPHLSFSLYQARPQKQSLMSHPQIQTKRILPLDLRLLALTGINRFQRRNSALSLSVREQKDTIWHSTFFTQPLRWAGPKVVTVYDLIFFLYAHYFQRRNDDALRQLMADTIRTADVVLCISATTAQDVITHFGTASDKVKVVPLAASPLFRPLGDELEELSAKNVIPTQKPFLLYVGSRINYKNFSVLLNAYTRWSYCSQVDLVVVGPPWQKSEIAEIRSKQATEKIHICTGPSDEQLNLLYNRALAFVYPSLYEGFGIPLLEAMSVGCPIIASDIPASREIARDYPIYFDPTNIDSLVDALDKVWLAKPELAHIHYGQQIAAQYSWQKTARKTLQQYYIAANLVAPAALRVTESTNIS